MCFNVLNQFLIYINMKWLKLFEEYSRVSVDQLVELAKNGGYIYTNTVKNYPHHKEDTPLKVVSVDNDGLTTVDIGGKSYEVDIENIKGVV